MTITVECPSCTSTFPVDSNKIPEGGVRARCSTCSTIFRIEKPEPAATPDTPEPDAPEPEASEPEATAPEETHTEEEAPRRDAAPAGPGPSAGSEARAPGSTAPPAQPPAPTDQGGPDLPPETSPAPETAPDVDRETATEAPAPEAPTAEAAAAETDAAETDAPEDEELGWGATPASPARAESPAPPEPAAEEETGDAHEATPAPETDAGEEDDFDPWGEPPGAAPDTGIPDRAPSGETGVEDPESPEAESTGEAAPAEARDEEADRHSVTVSQPPESSPPGFGAEELPGATEVVEPEPPDQAETEPGAGTVPDAVPSPSSPPSGFRFGKRDPDEKARRLARVLVSDMIMYNPERHARALENETLKEDFEEEIGKSWTEYVEQVGEEMARNNPYFAQALNEILAKGRDIFHGSPPY
jgi:predicted Zn finger-like uncharacterized protein